MTTDAPHRHFVKDQNGTKYYITKTLGEPTAMTSAVT